MARGFADEPLGVRGVGGIEYPAALLADGLRPSVVDVGGSMKPNAAVPMIVVIPSEEAAAVDAGVVEGTEALREVRPVLERPKMAF